MNVALNRPILVVAGLAGAMGVAAAAAAQHAGGENLAIAATFLQLHAPALLGLSLFGASRLAVIAAWVLVAGLVLFCGDLALRALFGAGLGLVAPLGGLLLIAGWLAVAASAFAGVRG